MNGACSGKSGATAMRPSKGVSEVALESHRQALAQFDPFKVESKYVVRSSG